MKGLSPGAIRCTAAQKAYGYDILLKMLIVGEHFLHQLICPCC